MLKVRIIPTLLWKDTSLVKGVGFDSWRRVDTVLPAIKVYNLREVDELVLLDISATKESREPDYTSIMEFASVCTVPFAVGGGINNVSQVKSLLRAGADKVVVNTAAYKDLEFVKEASGIFGAQCIVASVDSKLVNGEYMCFSHAGTQNTNKKLSEWVLSLEAAGVGEIMLTSIDKDGTMSGYDMEMIKLVTGLVSVPVIASGGAGSYEDLHKAIIEGGAAAVAAASIFHFTELTPKEAKMYLKDKGIEVRK